MSLLRLLQVRFHSKCHTSRGIKKRSGREEKHVTVFVGGTEKEEGALRGLLGSSGGYNVREEKSELRVNSKHQRLRGANHGSETVETDRAGYGFDTGHITGQSRDFLSLEKPCGLPILGAVAIAHGNPVWAKIITTTTMVRS